MKIKQLPLALLLLFCLVKVNAQPFITTWNTANAGVTNSTSIQIPTFGGGYNYNVDWNNDGTFDQFGITGTVTHNYGVAGIYTVAIQGNFPHIYFNNGGDKAKILTINQWGTINWTSFQSSFLGCTNLNVTATDVPNLSNVTSLANMFNTCSSLTGIGANWNWNTSTITNMSAMFADATPFNQNIGSWNTASVTSMQSMFYGLSLFNQNISAWSTASVTSMAQMFMNAPAFNQNIGGWNTSAVTNMQSMFNGASNFNQNIGSWNTTIVTDMSMMFRFASVFNQNIGTWNTGAVTNMSEMFRSATNFNQNIGAWNTGNVTIMQGMFRGATSFNQNIGAWNTSNVTTMQNMFFGASVFNQPIGGWNTASVVTMEWMFWGASAFNQAIGGWNTSSLTNMERMFLNATSFNQPIGGWDITNVTSLFGVFFNATSFNQNIGTWNTSNITNLNSTFYQATSFNHNIASWNTSAVTNMSLMFYQATSFNQNLGTWNLSSITPTVSCGAGSLCSMLANSGLDCFNYSATLQGWNANPATPNGIFLGATTLRYLNSAIPDRNNLTTVKSWNITGDALVPQPTFAFATSFTVCEGGAVPTLTVNSSNGANGIWSSASINNLSSGSYTYLPSTCHNSLVVNVTVIPAPTLTASSVSSNSICSGQTVTFTPSGANTYTLTSATYTDTSFPYTHTPTATTTYTIKGTNANGCVSTLSNQQFTTTVVVNANPTLSASAVSSNSICSGQTVTFTPSGANTYTLTSATYTDTTSPYTHAPTATTTYTLRGTSVDGCVSLLASQIYTTTVTVSNSPTLSASSVSSNTICSGQTVTFTPSGANTYTLTSTTYTDTTSPYTHAPTATTTYTLAGTNTANGCVSLLASQIYTTTVTVNASPTITTLGATSATICSGQSYTISNLSGATGNYTLTNTGATNATQFVVTPTANTTYTIIGANANNCVSLASSDLKITITVNNIPTLSASAVSSNSVCSGQTVTFTPSGANTYTLTSATYTDTTSPYTHAPTATTTYTLAGTNTANGCVSLLSSQIYTTTVTVSNSPTLSASSVSSNTICSGQTVTFTPSGANTYTLTSATYTDTTSPYTHAPTATTTYTLAGTNTANGCVSLLASQIYTTTVTVNATPTITALGATSATICSGEVFTITPTGASAGSYTLMPDNITTSASFTVSPTINVTYSINGANTNGCVSNTSSDLNVSLTVNTTPTVNALFSSNALCASQNVTITLSGADASYTLNPGNNSVSASSSSIIITPTAGTTIYTITATNANGCVSVLSSQIYTTSVSVVTNPTITASAITNSICSGTTASITPFGASTFTLMPDNISINSGETFTLNPTVATTYTINGTATGGCTSIASTQLVTTINIYNTPTITTSSALSNTICSGLTTTLSASGATSYTWAGGPVSMDYTVSPSATTVYTLIGTDANGCSNSNAPTTLTLTVLSSPTLALATSISTNTLCSGNSATITLGGASAGSTYTLLPSSAINTTSFVVNPTSTTNYTVMATDNANGCVSLLASQIYTTTVTVANSPTITLSSVAPSGTLCFGQSATLSVSGASTYTLINNNATVNPFVVTPSVTTSYSIAGTGANGCVNLPNTDLITTITVNQTPTISLLSVSPSQTVCAGQSATITANGASSYTLINTNATLSPFVVNPTVSTTYSIVGTSANGCVSDNSSGLTLTIDIGSGILVSSSSTSVTCFGGTNGQIVATVMSGGSVTYSWSTGSNAPVVSGLAAGTYSLTVKDNNDCINTQTTIISEPTAIIVSQTSLLASCDNKATGEININVMGGTPNYTVQWSNGAMGISPTNLPVGMITATVTDANNCNIIFNSIIGEKLCLTTLIPQMISPNGDGNNEFFFINTINSYPNNKLEIYNRWGNLVYSKEKYDNSFNGQPNVGNIMGSSLLPSGTYFVVFDFGDGKTETYKGYVEVKY